MLLVFRSELIQLVTVTQKEAESSYRELIKEQIYMYKNRWTFSLFLMCLTSCPTDEHSSASCVVIIISIYSFHSWLKVTEHLADRNLPVFTPGTKVTSDPPYGSIINVFLILLSLLHLTSAVFPPCSWRIKSGRWSRTSSRWVETTCRLTSRYWALTGPGLSVSGLQRRPGGAV